MRSEKPFLRDEESVLHVPGRVILGNIERFEIVIVILHVRAARDLEPHAEENIDNFVHHLGDRMDSSSDPPAPGKGDVYASFFQELFFGVAPEIFEPAADLLLAAIPQLVELRPPLRALFRRDLPQAPEEKSDLSIPAEIFDPQALDLLFRGRASDPIRHLLLQAFQGLFHRIEVKRTLRGESALGQLCDLAEGGGV
jgi:hypothetical protein